jgi:hypothetical protein
MPSTHCHSLITTDENGGEDATIEDDNGDGEGDNNNGEDNADDEDNK